MRLELVTVDGRVVDVHPAVWDDAGHARQEGLDGARYHYPATEVTTGIIGGRPVPAVSATLQRAFHDGYDPRSQDVHDLALLDELAGPR